MTGVQTCALPIWEDDISEPTDAEQARVSRSWALLKLGGKSPNHMAESVGSKGLNPRAC